MIRGGVYCVVLLTYKSSVKLDCKTSDIKTVKICSIYALNINDKQMFVIRKALPIEVVYLKF